MSVATTPLGRAAMRLILVTGFTFLYAPILLVLAYSFNASTSTTVWSGFSFRWYGELWQNDDVLHAARLSIEIALVSASGATILGTLVGYLLSRFGRFRTRTLIAGMATAPLVMPEIVLAVSLLLLFVGLESVTGWPHGRGVTTIILSHMTYTAAFVAVVVQGRLAGLDRSVEEAAQDLGARPVALFMLITVPMLAPAMVAGFLLAFSISLDDVVITQFTSGPGSTTLPLLIFSLVRRGVKPDINAVAALFVAFAIVVTFGIAALQRRWSGDAAQKGFNSAG